MSLDATDLVADVARLFAPSGPEPTIGAELEIIPVLREGKLPVEMESPSGPSLVGFVRRAAVRNGWSELAGDSGAPSWTVPGEARISFEPGGQIEISSEPNGSGSRLIDSLTGIVGDLSSAAELDGIELLSVGVDPYNDISRVPLRLGGDRYLRMTRYLEARGEFGIRMMRQTAALQISVEHGPRPLERWTLLNALAPYLIAIFANSPRYAGRDTGHASYRAHFWRELDESRTGAPWSADAVQRYFDFALDAGAIRAENGTGSFHTFRSLLGNPALTMEDWSFHLSTLFPEIRPKEYFEIRSADTIAVSDLPAPLTFIAGLVYDDRATSEALGVLSAPTTELLRTAGREGIRSAEIRARAKELARIALDGASRLPVSYLSAKHREHAAGWLARRLD